VGGKQDDAQDMHAVRDNLQNVYLTQLAQLWQHTT